MAWSPNRVRWPRTGLSEVAGRIATEILVAFLRRWLHDLEGRTRGRGVLSSSQARGKSVHVGQVNTQRRIKHCLEIDADTIDGTGFSRWPKRIQWGSNGDDTRKNSQSYFDPSALPSRQREWRACLLWARYYAELIFNARTPGGDWTDGDVWMRVLSLGGGQQSSAIYLLAATGEIPPIDYAIFAELAKGRHGFTKRSPAQGGSWRCPNC